MSVKKYVGLGSAAAFAAISIYGVGCSSSSSNNNTNPIKDSGHDTNQMMQNPDMGLPDLGTGGDTSTGDAGACAAPASVTGFSPVSIQPYVNAACTSTQAQNIIESCFITQSSSGCMAARTAAPGCDNCLEGSNYGGLTDGGAVGIEPGAAVPPAVGPWGALISIGWVGDTEGLINLNQGGCIATADPTFASCGTAINNVVECETFACASQCEVTASQASLTAYQNCTEAADMGACASYITASNTACASVPDGGVGTPAAPCFATIDFMTDTEAAFLAFVLVQCGGGDGGADQ
jgi:hypothetical protein